MGPTVVRDDTLSSLYAETPHMEHQDGLVIITSFYNPEWTGTVESGFTFEEATAQGAIWQPCMALESAWKEASLRYVVDVKEDGTVDPMSTQLVQHTDVVELSQALQGIFAIRESLTDLNYY
ncbi:hypothetical protein M231_00325 [Tremella mesenterica]|uniref:Uncharacterized protein n=1 Tax=Tremella mesenterica TaxID=5217 RepID=A0A4Q1BW13_TREME|nr:hypothetical protein M231_00325 [Tremella mesenterica]